MRSLIEGIERYEAMTRVALSKRFASLAHGQKPHALFLTCSDSRVVPNLVAAAGPGELFVVRNVANQVPPSTPEAPDVGADASVSSAVWYALEALNVGDVVVCGHSGCGGVKALLGGSLPAPSLEKWLGPASALVDRWREQSQLHDGRSEVDQLSQFITRHQLENLMSYSFVRERVERGQTRLHAWWFDIPAGTMLAWSESAARFVPALEALAEREEQQQRQVA
ncbi:MAG: carbonic anhydrase [Myxococcota bacterium]